MKKFVMCMKDINRRELISKLDALYEKVCQLGFCDKADEILNNNGASSDDSDSNEGFMKTMSNSDIQHAIDELNSVRWHIDPATVSEMIDSMMSGTSDLSSDYVDGFMDAVKMMSEEYNIDIRID